MLSYVICVMFIHIISAFKKFIRRSLTTLKYDVENIHKRLDIFKTLLEKIDDKILGQSSVLAVSYAADELLLKMTQILIRWKIE